MTTTMEREPSTTAEAHERSAADTPLDERPRPWPPVRIARRRWRWLALAGVLALAGGGGAAAWLSGGPTAAKAAAVGVEAVRDGKASKAEKPSPASFEAPDGPVGKKDPCTTLPWWSQLAC